VIPRVVEPHVPGTTVEAPARPVSQSNDINSIVDDVAGAHGVDPLLVHAIIRVESAYDPRAVSPKGAQGLMQLIPETARHFGVTNSFDKRQNVEGGVRYLRHLMSQFGDMRLVLAAYNAGENAVIHYNGIPPYDETQEYVYKVGKRYGELRRAGRTTAQRARAAELPPSEPLHRPVQSFIDSEGRINLITR
jgi:soluble lytic murein transglycosylase-like protein